jgi:hypothetical protein
MEDRFVHMHRNSSSRSKKKLTLKNPMKTGNRPLNQLKIISISKAL